MILITNNLNNYISVLHNVFCQSTVTTYKETSLYCDICWNVKSVFCDSGNAGIASAGCQALAALVLRMPTHCSVVIDNNGHHVILQAMKIHPTDEQVQVSATFVP